MNACIARIRWSPKQVYTVDLEVPSSFWSIQLEYKTHVKKLEDFRKEKITFHSLYYFWEEKNRYSATLIIWTFKTK